jgi:histidinol-phosphate aminotransferase
VIDHVMTRENVVVVRSFSNAFGLAGVRLGPVAGPAAVVAALFKVRTCFDINALAIAAAEWALEHLDVIHGCRSICWCSLFARRWSPRRRLMRP